MLVYGQDEIISAWVARQFNQPDDYFNPCRAIGIMKDDKIIAGIIYNNQQKHQGIPFMIEMSIASVDKSWATRHTLKALFRYPFIQLSLKRVNTQCDSKNKGLIMFNKRLGFKVEGHHKDALAGGGDVVSFGMLKGDCKWL